VSLLARLIERVPEARRAQVRERATVERELEDGLALAQQRWPAIKLDDAALWAEIAARIDDEGAPPAAEAFAEVYLAVACAAGDGAALAAFDAAYVANLGAVLGRFRLDRFALDEVKQVLRERLLLGAPPRVVRYSGRGGLARLVTVIAVRIALERSRVRAGGDGVAAEPAAPGDPELDYMHRAYSQAFKAAFERAVAELEPRERTLLRLHIVDQLSIDDIAAIYHVHRASVARRVEAARQEVARTARRHLRGAGIDREQLAAAFALVQSQLDLSITRVLQGAPDPVSDP